VGFQPEKIKKLAKVMVKKQWISITLL
jgi:hypothetical protein